MPRKISYIQARFILLQLFYDNVIINFTNDYPNEKSFHNYLNQMDT